MIKIGDCVLTHFGLETAIVLFWGYDINEEPWWITLEGLFVNQKDIVAIIRD